MSDTVWLPESPKILFTDVNIFCGFSAGPVTRLTALSAASATASLFMITISAVIVPQDLMNSTLL